MNSTQASATIFGFQFQINAAIYLMLKYFSDFDQMKIEGTSNFSGTSETCFILSGFSLIKT